MLDCLQKVLGGVVAYILELKDQVGVDGSVLQVVFEDARCDDLVRGGYDSRGKVFVLICQFVDHETGELGDLCRDDAGPNVSGGVQRFHVV